jgi:hypothetical protein
VSSRPRHSGTLEPKTRIKGYKIEGSIGDDTLFLQKGSREMKTEGITTIEQAQRVLMRYQRELDREAASRRASGIARAVQLITDIPVERHIAAARVILKGVRQQR